MVNEVNFMKVFEFHTESRTIEVREEDQSRVNEICRVVRRKNQKNTEHTELLNVICTYRGCTT
jgi:hypothetical protein